MDAVEERVAYLEGRVEEQGQMIMSIRDAIVSLEGRMDRRFAAIDQRFVGIDERLDGLDAKMSRQFVWLVGLIVTMLIAVVGGMSGVIAAILSR